jgi:hypothetical protein
LQSGFAASVLTYAMLVLRNVKGITLTIARDAHKCAEAVLKNAEGCHDRLGKKTIHFFL